MERDMKLAKTILLSFIGTFMSHATSYSAKNTQDALKTDTTKSDKKNLVERLKNDGLILSDSDKKPKPPANCVGNLTD
jgi:hypothetical protein